MRASTSPMLPDQRLRKLESTMLNTSGGAWAWTRRSRERTESKIPQGTRCWAGTLPGRSLGAPSPPDGHPEVAEGQIQRPPGIQRGISVSAVCAETAF